MKIVLPLPTNVFGRIDSFLIYVSKILADAGDDTWHPEEKTFCAVRTKEEKNTLCCSSQSKLSCVLGNETYLKTL